ncbi:MAG: lipoprotein insertase outer membrane protein LolB [Methylococcales bacterium]
MANRLAIKRGLFSWLIFLLSACSTVPMQPELRYDKSLRAPLSEVQEWTFEGRMALTGQNDSWSADIVWSHRFDHEQIKLSGPLGQGGVLINLVGDAVTIDRGNGNVRSSEEAENFINQELGLVVPVKFLSYWVVGLPKPDVSWNEIQSGFTQLGWLNEYKQMQQVNNLAMPKKINVTNGQVRLKLIVDQWHLGVWHE